MNEPADDPGGPGLLVTNLSIALLCLVWGSTWFVIREGLEDLPPFTSAGARFALAAAIMFCVSPVLARREGGRVPPLGLVFVMGLMNFAASYGIVYWSETRLPSGLVALLWAVYPMLMGAIGHVYLPGESLVPRQWLGLGVGFLGVLLLFWTDVSAWDRSAGLD